VRTATRPRGRRWDRPMRWPGFARRCPARRAPADLDAQGEGPHGASRDRSTAQARELVESRARLATRNDHPREHDVRGEVMKRRHPLHRLQERSRLTRVCVPGLGIGAEQLHRHGVESGRMQRANICGIEQASPVRLDVDSNGPCLPQLANQAGEIVQKRRFAARQQHHLAADRRPDQSSRAGSKLEPSRPDARRAPVVAAGADPQPHSLGPSRARRPAGAVEAAGAAGPSRARFAVDGPGPLGRRVGFAGAEPGPPGRRAGFAGAGTVVTAHSRRHSRRSKPATIT
jgi:hypothetical protein